MKYNKFLSTILITLLSTTALASNDYMDLFQNNINRYQREVQESHQQWTGIQSQLSQYEEQIRTAEAQVTELEGAISEGQSLYQRMSASGIYTQAQLDEMSFLATPSGRVGRNERRARKELEEVQRRRAALEASTPYQEYRALQQSERALITSGYAAFADPNRLQEKYNQDLTQVRNGLRNIVLELQHTNNSWGGGKNIAFDQALVQIQVMQTNATPDYEAIRNAEDQAVQTMIAYLEELKVQAPADAARFQERIDSLTQIMDRRSSLLQRGREINVAREQAISNLREQASNFLSGIREEKKFGSFLLSRMSRLNAEAASLDAREQLLYNEYKDDLEQSMLARFIDQTLQNPPMPNDLNCNLEALIPALQMQPQIQSSLCQASGLETTPVVGSSAGTTEEIEMINSEGTNNFSSTKSFDPNLPRISDYISFSSRTLSPDQLNTIDSRLSAEIDAMVLGELLKRKNGEEGALTNEQIASRAQVLAREIAEREGVTPLITGTQEMANSVQQVYNKMLTPTGQVPNGGSNRGAGFIPSGIGRVGMPVRPSPLTLTVSSNSESSEQTEGTSYTPPSGASSQFSRGGGSPMTGRFMRPTRGAGYGSSRPSSAPRPSATPTPTPTPEPQNASEAVSLTSTPWQTWSTSNPNLAHLLQVTATGLTEDQLEKLSGCLERRSRTGINQVAMDQFRSNLTLDPSQLLAALPGVANEQKEYCMNFWGIPNNATIEIGVNTTLVEGDANREIMQTYTNRIANGTPRIRSDYNDSDPRLSNAFIYSSPTLSQADLTLVSETYGRHADEFMEQKIREHFIRTGNTNIQGSFLMLGAQSYARRMMEEELTQAGKANLLEQFRVTRNPNHTRRLVTQMDAVTERAMQGVSTLQANSSSLGAVSFSTILEIPDQQNNANLLNAMGRVEQAIRQEVENNTSLLRLSNDPSGLSLYTQSMGFRTQQMLRDELMAENQSYSRTNTLFPRGIDVTNLINQIIEERRIAAEAGEAN